MKKSKVVGEILTTTEYSRFMLSPLNRKIRPKQIRKLKKLIEKDGFDPTYHIIVHDRDENGKKFADGGLLIFDGQHREKVCELLGLPVPYMVRNDWKRGDEFIDKNISQATWSLEDFRDHWAAKGVKDYQIVTKFMEQHPKLSLSISASLLTGKEGGDAYGLAFKEGRFKVENVRGAKEVADIVTAIRKLHKKHSTNTFIKAIQKMYLTPKFDKKLLMNKMSSAIGTTLGTYTTRDDYLKALEDVYNWHTPKPKKIKFYRV